MTTTNSRFSLRMPYTQKEPVVLRIRSYSLDFSLEKMLRMATPTYWFSPICRVILPPILTVLT